MKRGSHHSLDTCERMSLANRRFWTAERRVEQSARVSARMARPSVRQAIKNGMRRAAEQSAGAPPMA
jgi:hypothetical protein